MSGNIHIDLYVGKEVRIGKAIMNGRTREKGEGNGH